MATRTCRRSTFLIDLGSVLPPGETDPADSSPENPQHDDAPVLVSTASPMSDLKNAVTKPSPPPLCESVPARSITTFLPRMHDDDNNNHNNNNNNNQEDDVLSAMIDHLETVQREKESSHSKKQSESESSTTPSEPLTPPHTQLCQENTELKSQLSQLQHKHEEQIRGMQTHIDRLVAARAREQAIATEMIAHLERQLRAAQLQQQPQEQPKPKPVEQCHARRRGNSTPAPYRYAGKREITPFLGRADIGRARVVRGNMPPPPPGDSGTNSDNQYRLRSLSLHDSSTRYPPPPPAWTATVPTVLVTPAKSNGRVTSSVLPLHTPLPCDGSEHLERRPSAGLLAYCADLLASTLAPIASGWQVDNNNSTCSKSFSNWTSTPDTHYTSIAMPSSGSNSPNVESRGSLS